MNYIKKLEADQAQAAQAIAGALESLTDYRVFLLSSDKFTGLESDGSRKDWIATRDVVDFIDRLRGEIVDAAPARCFTVEKTGVL